jgi:predicted HTH transcriptional regulator
MGCSIYGVNLGGIGMSQIWDQAAIQEYIDEEREESLTLDYKAAGSLAKSDGKKAEITKDVSAMANSAGGIIIYGLAEYQDRAKEHLAEKIDPIDRGQFPKEWLEHVINNIRPHIDGLIIHPVPLPGSSNSVVYVVEIPQGSTAHQATDKRYYKRFNFESIPMEDYEIRDIMNRVQHPRIELNFQIKITEGVYYEQFTNRSSMRTDCELLVYANNI